MPCIAICPIQIRDTWFLEELSHNISQVFGCETKEIDLLDNLEFAHHEGRRQYYSTAINNQLEQLLPKNFLKVLAITKVDLFIPILTHVYGEAQLNGRACIISIRRLQPKNLTPEALNKFKTRIIKEGLHELGHTFDLRHCQDPRCIMHYCRNIRDVDKKNPLFCHLCQVQLQEVLAEVKQA